MSEPMSTTDLDEISTRAAHLHEYVTMPTEAEQLAGVDVPDLLAEMERLRAALDAVQKERQDIVITLEAAFAADPAKRGLSALLSVERAQRRQAEEAWEQAEAERDQIRQQLEGEAVYQGLLRDERDHLAEVVKRVRELHSDQCGGYCAAIPCECGPDDLLCAECETPSPCPTLLALDAES